MEKEEEDDLLIRLRTTVFGNGSKGLVTKVDSLEDNFHKISLKLTVVVVLLMILITVQAPALLAGLRVM